jgi:hypothetical protein
MSFAGLMRAHASGRFRTRQRAQLERSEQARKRGGVIWKRARGWAAPRHGKPNNIAKSMALLNGGSELKPKSKSQIPRSHRESVPPME